MLEQTGLNKMKKLLVSILFVLFGTQVIAQDYNKGLKAYNAMDYATAIKEWKPLAEQGYAKAQYNLGLMYKNGNGVLKDATEAVKWYRLAAEQGDAQAQRNLGHMSSNGNGVLKDNLTAHMWYNIASANGSKAAGEWRDERADLMTPDAIEKATSMARECMASDYKKCGY